MKAIRLIILFGLILIYGLMFAAVRIMIDDTDVPLEQ